MSLTAIASILYMVVVLAVGYISIKGKKTEAREHFVADSQLPWILLAPMLMAEFVSGGTTVGLAEKVHQDGVTVLMYYLGMVLGFGFYIFVFAKFYYAIKKMTVGEAFRTLFDQKTRMAFVVVTFTLGIIGSGTAGLALGVTIGPMLGIPYDWAIWVAMGLLIILALFGLRGQAWMNVIHLGGILLTFIPLSIVAVTNAGGLGKIAAALPAGHLNLMGAGLWTVIAWIISGVLVRSLSPLSITAMFAAKSERDGKIALVSAAFMILAFVLLPALMALAGFVLTPGIESRHALWDVSAHMGEWARSFASIGVLAAIISTTPPVLLAYSAIVTRDIFLSWKPNLSDRAQVFISRCAVVFLGFFALYISIIATEQAGGILAFIFKSTQARIAMAIPLIVSVLWRRLNPTVVFWSIVVGVPTGAIWLFAGSPFHVEPLWPALAVNVTVLVIGSLLAKPSHYKGAEGLVPATNSGRESGALH